MTCLDRGRRCSRSRVVQPVRDVRVRRALGRRHGCCRGGEMRMSRVCSRLLTRTSLVTLLVALASAGCGVETTTPLPTAEAPRLESMGSGVVCPPRPPECTGEFLGRCCAYDSTCRYTRCALDGQVCKSDVCQFSCDAGTDCNKLLGLAPTDGFSCNKDNVCSGKTCTSNRGCDATQVCQGSEDAGVCVPVTGDERDLDPGCSAGAPGHGGFASAVSTLALLVALRRRRRSE